ncbi:MAG: DoxX family membrane protein [Acidobacteriaceae bacterium]
MAAFRWGRYPFFAWAAVVAEIFFGLALIFGLWLRCVSIDVITTFLV